MRTRQCHTDNSLHWFADVLQAAENAGERVLVLRHIPNVSRSVRAAKRALARRFTLTLVEDGGQRRPAHALASRCNAAWSLNYHKILVRYENAIVAAFTGHSHWDHFELHYRDDVARTEAAVINYIGPSATTSGSFPAFRIYEVGAAVRMARPRIGDAAAQPAARACIR